MLRDLDRFDGEELPTYDVCIVGTGPAGTTLINELVGSGLSIAVLESGRMRSSRYADELRTVRSEGIHIKDYSRERVLGGTSTTWAGLSSPLDATDLEPRPWLRHSGWPIGWEELREHYAAAAERYRFPQLDAFGPGGFGALRAKGSVRPDWKQLEEKIFLACSEPQNFGREFRDVLDGEGVDVWLDATLTSLDGEVDGGRVARGSIRTRSGRRITVRARAYVLACGGIENARVLLGSQSPWQAGLGNERDQVGRYLMNHPKNYCGLLPLKEPVEDLPYWFGCLFEGFAGYAGLRLQEPVQREGKLLNSYVRLEPLFPWSDNRGIEALVLCVKRTKLLLAPFRKRSEEQAVVLRDYSETGDDTDLQNERKSLFEWLGLVFSILVNAPRVAQYLWYRIVPGAVPKVRVVRLRNFMEMEPDPDNRVVLGDETNAHGQRLPVVRHDSTRRDRESLVTLHAALRDEFAAAGLGQLSTDLQADATPWPIDEDASHHMGTTRMGTDPKTSVVDPNGRVHGVDNVWLAGASVFPTSGCANPTFTIVALSIRLAQHLKQELGATR